MSSTQPAQMERSYGCTFGCGNPYDYIVINVQDGSAEFLCLPCFVRLATDMVAAVTNPDDPKVREAMAAAASNVIEMAPGPKGKSRGHNAPATNNDPDLLDSFDDVVTVDELPPEFR